MQYCNIIINLITADLSISSGNVEGLHQTSISLKAEGIRKHKIHEAKIHGFNLGGGGGCQLI